MEQVRRVREERLAAVWPVMTALRAPAAGLQWGLVDPGEGGGSLRKSYVGGVECWGRGPRGRG